MFPFQVVELFQIIELERRTARGRRFEKIIHHDPACAHETQHPPATQTFHGLGMTTGTKRGIANHVPTITQLSFGLVLGPRLRLGACIKPSDHR